MVYFWILALLVCIIPYQCLLLQYCKWGGIYNLHILVEFLNIMDQFLGQLFKYCHNRFPIQYEIQVFVGQILGFHNCVWHNRFLIQYEILMFVGQILGFHNCICWANPGFHNYVWHDLGGNSESTPFCRFAFWQDVL